MPDLAIPLMADPKQPKYTHRVQPIQIVNSQAKPVANYLFVNNVRFLSMAAVVSMHCIEGFGPMGGISSTGYMMHGMLQPFKFGTIGFFLISGFLMGEGVTRRRPSEYMKRRLQKVFKPWMIWFSLCCAMWVASDAVHGRLNAYILSGVAQSIRDRLYNCLFGTAYWFVPNLLIALCVLLLCRRFLYDVRLGGALFAVSLLYGLNIYTHWVALSSHTEALFGFVFYLWLGAWAAKNMDAVMGWIERISMPAVIASAAMTGLVALQESELLARVGVADSMDTLRISNQLYSLVVVLLIVKIHKAISPRALNVRTSTFGIYLTHMIVLLPLISIASRTIKNSIVSSAWGATAGTAVCLSLVGFMATYGCSLALTKWLLGHPRLCWTVGASAANKVAHTNEEFHAILVPTPR